MPRPARVEIEGGVYHVYNRVASGEGVFAKSEEAVEFVDRIHEIKQRDGWAVFAWAVLSNHFHLAIRTSAASLATSMHALQGRFSRAFNRRWSRSGGLWQSRYHAKLIDEQRYLAQVVLYVHLNPVRAGVVKDPAAYPFSGHREIVRSVRDPIVDVDEALLSFGETRRDARRAYMAGIRAGVDGDVAEGAGSARWWESIPWRDDALRARAHALGARHVESLEGAPSTRELVRASCSILKIDLKQLNSRARDRKTAAMRRLTAFVLSQRWGQSRSDLAELFERNPEVVSHWMSEGRALVAQDADFGRRVEQLDVMLKAAMNEAKEH